MCTRDIKLRLSIKKRHFYCLTALSMVLYSGEVRTVESITIDAKTITNAHGGFFMSPGFGRHITRTRDDWEIIYVVSGTLRIFEEDNMFEVGKNQVLILNPNRCHGGTADYKKDLKFYWFHFFADTCDENCKDAVTVQKLSNARRPQRMVEMFQNFFEDETDCSENETRKGMQTALLLYEIQDSSKMEKPSAESFLASKINRIIHTDFRGDITTTTLAQMLGYNHDYIARVYKKAYGSTVHHKICSMRAEYAAGLLMTSDFNISQIAELSGFKTPADFNRIFKNCKGMSPTNYKNKMLAKKYNIK